MASDKPCPVRRWAPPMGALRVRSTGLYSYIAGRLNLGRQRCPAWEYRKCIGRGLNPHTGVVAYKTEILVLSRKHMNASLKAVGTCRSAARRHNREASASQQAQPEYCSHSCANNSCFIENPRKHPKVIGSCKKSRTYIHLRQLQCTISRPARSARQSCKTSLQNTAWVQPVSQGREPCGRGGPK